MEGWGTLSLVISECFNNCLIIFRFKDIQLEQCLIVVKYVSVTTFINDILIVFPF